MRTIWLGKNGTSFNPRRDQKRWNADTYGQWIAISAVPAYLTIADVGIMTAAGNLMSMHNARGEHQQVKSVFKAGLSVVLMVVPTVSTLAGLLLYFFSFGLSPDQRRALFMLTLPAAFNGNCALTCPVETNNSGIGVPLTTRQDSPIAVGSGICDVAMLVALNCEPYTLMNPPGATAVVPLAAFSTLAMAGGVVAAA